MANRFRLEQIQEFYITPTVTQHGAVPKWNNNTKRFDWAITSLELGIGHTDAYYGDLGKIAYDHSQIPHVFAASRTEGIKRTGYDAGTIWDMSITDDYLYICVQTGNVSTSIWKKTVLFHTP